MDALAWILLVVAVMGVVAFGAMHFDKRRAQRGGRRIRERTLLLLALLGGSVGLLLGMGAFRHKTRKPSFLARVLVVVLIQAIVVAAWLYPSWVPIL